MNAPAALPGWPHPGSPFHRGEQAVQDRLGVRAKIEAQGQKVVRDALPPQHQEFYPLLPFLVPGTVDQAGQPWASVVAGAPGFLSVPDDRTLRVQATPLPGDPLAETLRPGAEIGVVGLQLSTRRRNRISGVVSAVDDGGFTIAVKQTLGNCPQYIQAREVELVPPPPGPTSPPAPAPAPTVIQADRLDARARAIIADADTLFIATATPAPTDGGAAEARVRGADASHRGGKPGFVRLDDDRTLTIPDFVGNFIFNTIGNLVLEPRVGVLFIDFISGDLVSLAGTVEVIWDGPEVQAFAGAERLLRLHVTHMTRTQATLPLGFSPPVFSPMLERTGDWAAAAATLEAARTRNVYRPFQVTRIVTESATIRSLYLEPADGGGLAPWVAGQYLPIRLSVAGQEDPVLRTYTLSDAPDGSRAYRITVRRETPGLASAALHALSVGDRIQAIAPRGDFTFDHGSRRPVVMIAGGVGVTPLVAMLNSLLVNDGRTRHPNRIVFIQAARDGGSLAFGDHLRDKAARHANLSLHVRLSAPGPDDRLGQTFDSVGRVDRTLLQSLLPLDDYDVYLCGPPGFMQSLYTDLRSLGVADGRIRFEAFGPASVRRDRTGSETADAAPAPLDAGEAVAVTFARSGRRLDWRPADGTLLDLAEAAGLAPAYSCRAGVCGTCAVRVTGGAVQYAEAPVAQIAVDHALLCCATPRPGPHLPDSQDREGVTLDL